MKQSQLKPYQSILILSITHMAPDSAAALLQRERLELVAIDAIRDGVTVPKARAGASYTRTAQR